MSALLESARPAPPSSHPTHQLDGSIGTVSRTCETLEGSTEVQNNTIRQVAIASQSGQRSIEENQQDNESALPQRATRACQRCRRMKLRCVGNFPCQRCRRGRHPCGVGPDEGHQVGDRSSSISSYGGVTMELGSNPQSMAPSSSSPRSLIGLQPPSNSQYTTQSNSNGSRAPETPLFANLDTPSRIDKNALSHGFRASLNSTLQDVQPFEGDTSLFSALQSSLSPSLINPFPGGRQLSIQLGMNARSDINDARSVVDSASDPNNLPSHRAGNTNIHGSSSAVIGNRDTPENRLAMARESSISQAAFRPLLIQSRAWGYAEASRPPSPGGGSSSADYGEEAFMTGGFEGKVRLQSDPVTDGIMDILTAERLVNFFFEHCHQFMPILYYYRKSPSVHTQLRQRSAFLYTVVLAVAARLYPRHAARFEPPNTAPLPDSIPSALRQMAYAHVAATIMRKEQSSYDLQAILILSVWGLLGQGRGPDPWLLTSIVQRLLHRLETHKASRSPLVRRIIDGGSLAEKNTEAAESESLEKLMSQWRASLACYYFDSYLSLNFGRPLSIVAEPIQEELFIRVVQARSHTETLATDMYLASQVQLAKISREFVTQAQALNELRSEPPTPMRQQFLPEPSRSMSVMLADLNKRLDEWDFRWAWNGSLAVLQMGAHARFAKLQAQHVRLSVNSVALRSDSNRDVTISEDGSYLTNCVVKATESAICMIDMHAEALRSDFVFSYSFEYIFNALAQAALFIIRLHASPEPAPVERPVLFHYLKTAVEVIEGSDMSVTGHSTTMARILRDLVKAAGIDLHGTADSHELPKPTLSALQNDSLIANDPNGGFDFETFLQMDALDCDYNFFFQGSFNQEL